MVVTRSQGDAAEKEERERLEQEQRTQELQRIELERVRRLSLVPPASPDDPGRLNAPADGPPAGTSAHLDLAAERRRSKSPARSQRSAARSQRSTASATLRLRMAELEAAEKLAELERRELRLNTERRALAAEQRSLQLDAEQRELRLDAELVKKRLAVQAASIRDDESQHDDRLSTTDDHGKVDNWLRNNPPPPTGGAGDTHTTSQARQEPRRARFEPARSPTPPRSRRGRSPTPTRTRRGIEQLAEAIEKMAKPRPRHATDLPTFAGAPGEWLPFKAAMRDATAIYNLSAAENIQRLRHALKGEARDSVSALLSTATDPAVVMATLEQCYGRPEVIIDRAMEDLKKLPRLGASAAELNTFAIKVQNVVCVLETIDQRGYLHNPMLMREVQAKLSPYLWARYCDYTESRPGTSDPKIVLLSRFLMREADLALRNNYMQSTSTAAPARSEPKPAAAAPRKKANAVYAVATTEELDRCPSCGQTHALHRCPTYMALDVDRRWELVRDKGLCFRCVEKKHRRFRCSNAVLLKVCPVVLAGPLGEVRTYALLDEGATITLIDEELARKIGAQGPTRPLHIHGVNMSQREQHSKIVTVQIRSKRGGVLHDLRARTVRDLQLHQQSIPSELLEHEHLRDLQQDEVCYELARPRILVGADHWEFIVSRELRVGGPNQPAASRTRLGWVIHGTVPRSVIYHCSESVLHVYAPDRRLRTSEQHDQRLHELVEAHFHIDALGVAHKPRVSDADLRAANIVENSIRKIDGGYEVGLPWQRDDVTMPPSYGAAVRRLKGIERKMDADPAFANEYSQQVDNLLAKGYAVPCDGTEQQSAVSWFLPHFAVQNPNKPGKRRLVFDAAHRSNGVSLNDQLLEGPDLLLSLQGILFRFRERPIAVCADIQEMFLRIKIRPEDQPAQQFLWRDRDRANPPRHYKMTSVIFGAASSPYMAHSVRDFNARAHAQTHPRALVAITRSHYMDDLVDSYENEEEARCTVRELQEVHATAGFTLRGWNANNTNVLRDVPTELRATTHTELGAGGPANKILGLYWSPEEDELAFNTAMHRVPTEVRTQTRLPTKREALSAVMSIYDPLGLLSHYTIRAKIVLQSLWRLQLPWDDPIPAEEAEQFAAWLQQLGEIGRLRLRRSYALELHQRVELHVLCDASEQAYATVAYWRATRSDGSIHIALVGAKAKVAPRRAQSIPRLELQAAVIGARLADTIKKEHRIEVARTVYWTDSATVVHWVHNDARRYTPFVAHRLGELAELTDRGEWRWLPTDLNVADDATRLSQGPISADERWFQGPSFLRGPEESWPAARTPAEDEHEVLHTNTLDERRDDWLPDPARFSRFERLVRAAARVLAFIDICRRRASRLELRHIERAEQALLRRTQEDSFGAELKKLAAARPIPRASRLYRLDPVLEDGLLRVRGRIGASSAPAATQRSVILDGRHPVTRLLVLREHSAAGHANRERVTNDLRQRYWIIHLRPTVRAVEHSCALCRVRRAKPEPPATGDLPRARLDPFHRPFTNCGVDYFGPMTVKVGRRREKRWGALFTCLTMRAVHLEIVASLSTDSALMALRRMAARRGWPSLMYSDNATNFRGADQELKKAYAEWTPALHNEGLLHRMEWRYIPPGAPNQGGAWERMVRSVKTALNATLREKVPTEEVLQTLLTEAEFTINARPLTHVSVSPNDPEALTPNHFLLGSSTGLPTTGPCEENDRRAWRASQALADHFWRRWLREYLPTLVPRGEPENKHRNLRVGDIVVVVDGALPRNVWPMGIVEQTHIGPDGGVRVADVKTKTGVFRRPASKLAVLVKEENEAARVTPGGGC